MELTQASGAGASPPPPDPNLLTLVASLTVTARLRGNALSARAIRCAGAFSRNMILLTSSSFDGRFASCLMSAMDTTRPSTTPALNWNAGTSLAILVMAFASATGSASVSAIEFVPVRFFSRFSAGVPAPARSASVFFTTLYLPPAACTARRSLVSWSTLMPWKVVRITVETLASSDFSLSRSACFSLRFFINPLATLQRLSGGCCQRLRFGQVDGDAWPHRRGQCDFLDVLALGRGGLGLDHGFEHRVGVAHELRRIKLNLADRAMHDSGFVHAEFHFAGFHFLDGLGHFKRDRAGLGIGHQTTWAEHFAELSGGAHHVRGGNHGVEIRPALHDFLYHVVAADEVRAGFLRFAHFFPARDDQHAHGLAQPVRQAHGSAHHLVGMLRIDSQIDGQFHGFVELRVMQLLQQLGRFAELVRARRDLLARILHMLP